MIVYSGEWVKFRNLMNKRFKQANAVCEDCGRGSCGMVWQSIRTHRVRCVRCFDAETEHWERGAAGENPNIPLPFDPVRH